jgi:hypothetical protein
MNPSCWTCHQRGQNKNSGVGGERTKKEGSGSSLGVWWSLALLLLPRDAKCFSKHLSRDLCGQVGDMLAMARGDAIVRQEIKAY